MADLELGPLRFGIVGAGRLGRVLGRALQQRELQVVTASARTPEGRAAASHALQVAVFDEPAQAAVDADVLLLCVPDDAIVPVAAHLATLLPASDHTDGRHLRVVHTSGCVRLDALEPLRALGHDTLSLHPLQTVTETSSSDDLVGAAAAVTAHDDAGRTFGHALAHAVGMHPFDLDDGSRALYHAASTVSANFSVTLQGLVRDLAREAGMHEGVARAAFGHLAHAAITRVEQEGPERALTGPIARGDTGTVASHLSAIDVALPQHASLYRELAAATIRLAVDAGTLTVDEAAQMGRLVRDTPAGSEA